jgi:hypothetical protein
MEPEKAAWTIDAWLQVLRNRGAAGQKKPPIDVDKLRPELETSESRAREFMLQTFEKGATVEQVAGLLTSRYGIGKHYAAAMAKDCWAGLPAQQRQPIRKVTPKPAPPLGWQQKALIVFGVLMLVVGVYEVFFRILPTAWHFVRMAWSLALAGEYVPAVIVVVMAALALLGFAQYGKGKH